MPTWTERNVPVVALIAFSIGLVLGFALGVA